MTAGQKKAYRLLGKYHYPKPDRCKNCGKKVKTLHRHHRDYRRPLCFVWLCPLCHRREHCYGKNKARANNYSGKLRRGYLQRVYVGKLNSKTVEAITDLMNTLKTPENFNVFANRLLVYGIPEFQKKELLLRGQLAQSKKYKTK